MRLRFSLATLILGTLLLASSATFWWNWQQWTPVTTIDINGDIKKNFFLQGERTFCIHTRSFGFSALSGRFAHCLTLYDTRTGALIRSFEGGASEKAIAGFSPDEKYIYLHDQTSGFAKNSGFDKIWHLASGEEIDANKFESIFVGNSHFLHDSTRLLTQNDDKYGHYLLEFPSLKILHEYPNSETVGIPNSTGHFCLRYDKAVEVYYNSDGSLCQRIEFNSDNIYVYFFDAYSKIVLCDGLEPDAIVYDIGTRQEVCHLYGNYLNGEICDALTPSNDNHLTYNDKNSEQHLYNIEDDSDQIIPESMYGPGFFNIDAEYLLSHNSSFNMKSKQITAQIDAQNVGNGRLRIIRTDSFINTIDIRTGESLGKIYQYRWPDQFGNTIPLVFRRELAFLTQNEDHLTLWRQTMPNKFTGALRMPEFWITVAILCALIWQLRRNRRFNSFRRYATKGKIGGV